MGPQGNEESDDEESDMNENSTSREYSVTLTLRGFNEPSPIDNNDFSQGADGWEEYNSTDSNSTSVYIVAHEEEVGPDFQNATSNSQRDTLNNQDIVLDTNGIYDADRTLSRTFTTDTCTNGVEVRYRFVTSQVPNNFCNSEYNDHYSVSIRTSTTTISETNSMNGLGCDGPYSAFDYNTGSTAW